MFFIESNEIIPNCPICGERMTHYDSIKRIWRKEGGSTDWIVIRRFRCDKCSRIMRELPDVLTPYKHYETDVIEGVIEGIIQPTDKESEDFPTVETMERWKDWIRRNKDNINGFLKSIGYRILEFGVQLLQSKISLLDELIKLNVDWLRIVNRFIYNSGERLAP